MGHHFPYEFIGCSMLILRARGHEGIRLGDMKGNFAYVFIGLELTWIPILNVNS